jgi:hypothetical protein
VLLFIQWLQTFLWYDVWGSAPHEIPPTDPGGIPTLNKIFLQTTLVGVTTLQIGYEPSFWVQDTLYGMNLGTSSEAFTVPNLDKVIQLINSALDKGVDPLKVLNDRNKTIEAMDLSSGKGEWMSLTVNLNRFIVSVVSWARFLVDEGNSLTMPSLILRPFSEMNEADSGSYCFGTHPANTAQNLATSWILLRHVFLTALANLPRVISPPLFAFSPLTYNSETVRGKETAEALSEIMRSDSNSIDFLSLNIYAAAKPNGLPFLFNEVTSPWKQLYDSLGIPKLSTLPWMAAECGIDRTEFPSDNARAVWVTKLFSDGKLFGMQEMTYFWGKNGNMNFEFEKGDPGYAALINGIAEFQNTSLIEMDI